MNKKKSFLILIIILIIIIGIVQGIDFIHSIQAKANRAGVKADIKKLGQEAQEFYKKASAVKEIYKFNGWNVDREDSTKNGTYSVTVTEQQVVIEGTGKEIGKDGETKIKVTGIVTPTSITFIDNN